MDELSPREILEKLITEHRANYGALSRLIGRNAAYIQQFIKRGTPRKLDEDDRRLLAEYFGVDEALLGGPDRSGEQAKPAVKSTKNDRRQATALVSRLELEASAGCGAIVGEEKSAGVIGFDQSWLRRHGLNPETLSIIDVKGESMAPTLLNGDTIMVDRSDGASRLREGVYVLRLEDMLMVKRILFPDKGRGEGVTISSDNDDYPSWHGISPDRVDIIGRVIWTAHLLR